MRLLTDSSGVEWTVFEVKRDPNAQQGLSYLPEEFGQGWLCFESRLSKRRLTPVPPRWKEYGDAELERLLIQAQSVSRARLRPDDRASDR